MNDPIPLTTEHGSVGEQPESGVGAGDLVPLAALAVGEVNVGHPDLVNEDVVEGEVR